MKTEEREKARELRANGFSINEITRQLGVSKSSVSIWVRDIQLSATQRAALIERNRRYSNQEKGARAVSEKFRRLRSEYQAEGRERAKAKDWLHVAGCMIYWSEGRKERNYLKLTNSDPNLICLFIKFLRISLGIKDDDIGIRITCYTNNNLGQSEIETFWLNTLALPHASLRKTIVNRTPISSQQKAAKHRILLYGVCTVEVPNVRIVQHIYGAIQEYGGFENNEWLG